MPDERFLAFDREADRTSLHDPEYRRIGVQLARRSVAWGHRNVFPQRRVDRRLAFRSSPGRYDAARGARRVSSADDAARRTAAARAAWAPRR